MGCFCLAELIVLFYLSRSKLKASCCEPTVRRSLDASFLLSTMVCSHEVHRAGLAVSIRPIEGFTIDIDPGDRGKCGTGLPVRLFISSLQSQDLVALFEALDALDSYQPANPSSSIQLLDHARASW